MAMRAFESEGACEDRYGVSTIRTHAVLRILELLNTGKNHHDAKNKTYNTKGKQDHAKQKLAKTITIPPAHRNTPDAREGFFSVRGVRLTWLAEASRMA